VNIYNNKNTLCIDKPPINQCPICNAYIEPTLLYSIVFETKGAFNFKFYHAVFLYLCPKCGDTFICKSKVSEKNGIHFCQNLEYAPLEVSENIFPEVITSNFPKFVEIYNQSYKAEQQNLLEICGMGYRKALEFLIKDFLILKSPDDKENLEDKPLSQCVKLLSEDNPKLGIVAGRAAWLGNDEAHYIRKHTEYDLTTLKSLIKATIAYIELDFITISALTIERK